MELSINNIEGNNFGTSSNVYDIYRQNKDSDIFESVLDNLILDKFSDDLELNEYIKSLPKKNKRIATLSLLSDDNVLWKEINELLKSDISSYKRLKSVYFLLKEYIKIAEVERKKHGEIHTPFKELAEPMVKLVEKYDEDFWKNKDHKVLDSSAGYGTFLILAAYKFMVGLKDEFPDEEERFKWIIENCLYYGELQSKSVFSWLVAIDPYDIYKTNIYWGDFLSEDFDNHMKEVWGVEKFDLIIQNPPYKNGKHIRFFNKSFDMLMDDKYMIFIHPSTQFINRKPSREDAKTKKIKKIVLEYKSNIKLIDGNFIFNAGFFTPLSITTIKKTPNKEIEVIYSHINKDNNVVKKYENFEYISIHGNDITKNIRDKIMNKMDISIDDKLFRNKSISKIGKYLKICRISGHPPKKDENIINPDFFQIIYKKDEDSFDNIITYSPVGKRNDGNQFNEISIDCDLEIENLHKYLMTKFARFCLSFYKNSANILSDLKAVPYLDFSKEWSDKDLFEYFNLTDSEIKFILEFIPNWYKSDFET